MRRRGNGLCSQSELGSVDCLLICKTQSLLATPIGLTMTKGWNKHVTSACALDLSSSLNWGEYMYLPNLIPCLAHREGAGAAEAEGPPWAREDGGHADAGSLPCALRGRVRPEPHRVLFRGCWQGASLSPHPPPSTPPPPFLPLSGCVQW